MTIHAELIPTTAPQPVRVIVDAGDMTAGTAYQIVGVTLTGDTWPVPGGQGIATGEAITLIDNRAALNQPVRYRVLVGGRTELESTDTVTVTFAGDLVIQSLDGQRVFVPTVFTREGFGRELVVRSVTFDVPGRRRPPARYELAGDGGSSFALFCASKAASDALVAVAQPGAPLVYRTGGQVRDIAPVDLILVDSLTSASNPDGSRLWTLAFTFIDDPDPTALAVVWDWDDFDEAAVRMGWDWDDFDAFFAATDWDTFDQTAWSDL